MHKINQYVLLPGLMLECGAKSVPCAAEGVRRRSKEAAPNARSDIVTLLHRHLTTSCGVEQLIYNTLRWVKSQSIQSVVPLKRCSL